MSTHYHTTLREIPIQQSRRPSPSFTLDAAEPFRDPGWQRGDQLLWRDHQPWRQPAAVTRDQYWPEWYHQHRDMLVPRDFYGNTGSTNARDHQAGALIPSTSTSSPSNALALTNPALPASRAFFTPEHQLSLMDREMSRMASEMRRVLSGTQHLMPGDYDPDSWRIKENFLLENPIVHDNEGNRMFRLRFDVRQFRPEEIFVKTTGKPECPHWTVQGTDSFPSSMSDQSTHTHTGHSRNGRQ